MPIKRRVLCVDDHPDICELVSVILTDYEVVFATSKLEGLRKAEGGLFDLYLLDYALGDGLELTTRLRQFDDFTPILLITNPHALTNRQVSELGAQGLVSRDDLPDNLLRTISDILHQ